MDIRTLDLNFQNVPQAIASYLVIGPDGPVLVETGPGSTLAALQAELARHGYEPADIHHVLVTHIHLDHAGAAGWWAQQGAQVYVHYFGARHLIDPSKLWASASRIYGDKMEMLWGEMLPAPAERVTAVHNNDTIQVAGLTFTALETPGHARHHHVWQLGDVAFTGDAVGIRLPHNPLVDVPAPPPEFDRETWLETLDRLQAAQFSALYPTHFGRLEDVDHQIDSLRALLDDAPNFIRKQMQANVSRDDMIPLYEEWVRDRARALGLTEMQIHQYEMANPLYMSVDGIVRYWRKME
ncbi:MAG: MBL fold metallo-hydrolase [Ardenticatenaceae bacterium]|nr:MBL fold metallo-hydrolase [Anaerolineales bacterium]MCB8923622.1 MBL fold metallo-hydrolase [Ardenticatenaceae bacterium]MCB8991841.1 MBL fold metallo-hydrolase [Ardenticatenaceae bacterium]